MRIMINTICFLLQNASEKTLASTTKGRFFINLTQQIRLVQRICSFLAHCFGKQKEIHKYLGATYKIKLFWLNYHCEKLHFNQFHSPYLNEILMIDNVFY